ncbi:MAG: hypothetical protein ACQEQ0_00865, partial [Bacteroidota bacterium]
MGVTIHYRGGLNDINRVEDFEDRVLDFALAIGASARIWRSVSDQRSDRIVRGVIVELAPGQESTCLHGRQLVRAAGFEQVGQG